MQRTKPTFENKKLTIFVGGPIQYVFDKKDDGADKLKRTLEMFITQLEKAGHNVLSAHRYENYGEMDVANKQKEVCSRDHAWMSQCDAFIAVLPEGNDKAPIRTDGTCVELGWASALNKRIAILHSKNISYSHLVAGLGSIATVLYQDIESIYNGKKTAHDIVSDLFKAQTRQRAS